MPMPRTDESFEADCDSDAGILRLKGDCRALDLGLLEGALVEWQQAGARTLDVTEAGRFDIGPAWLLKRFLDRARTSGPGPRLVGEAPAHFT
jgi:hypothetical protein